MSIYERIQESVAALELTLRKSLLQVLDLDSELKQLREQADSCRSELQTQIEKCEKKSCSGSEALTKLITKKEYTMTSIESALKKYLESKDLSFINEVFRLLCIQEPVLTPPKELKSSLEKGVQLIGKENKQQNSATFTMDISIEDEIVSEIEGTPTGRTSPIIQSKIKPSLSSLLNSTDHKDKKKCPASWPTPPRKNPRTAASTSANSKGTRMRQQRLNLSKLRASTVVDLTSSPEFSGGIRTQRSDSCGDVKPVIKKELLDSDETILPSPTSDPAIFPTAFYKTVTKASPAKRKPSLKLKRDSDENGKQRKSDGSVDDVTDMEDSINLLNQQPNRFKKPLLKIEKDDPDKTECEKQNISNVKEVNKLEIKKEDCLKEEPNNFGQKSPSKRPLVENINVVNVESNNFEASMSLLRSDVNAQATNIANDSNEVKLTTVPVEEVFKDPTVRKKAEKRALPGWSCDECRIFYDEMYKDNPEMLAKLMNECSKHRGRKNPARPKTPEGFWNPRWDVPEDTEEFNKRNNAA